MWLEVLNEMKRKSGKTTEQISLESGIPRGTLNKLFAGQTKDPGYSTISAVVHTLGFTVDDLDTQKNAAESEGEDPAETAARAERLYTALVEAGWIPEGGDLTDEQLNLLEAVVLILKSAFPE